MQLIGLARIGRDAEIRYTANGDAVTTLSLAFNYGRKDATTGRKPSEWVKASLWGKQAEALVSYLTKGKQVVVTIDDPHIEYFDKQDGTKGSNLSGKITSIEFAGSNQDSQQAAPQQQAPAPRQAPPQAQRQAPAPRQASQGGSGGFDDMDDSDIPY